MYVHYSIYTIFLTDVSSCLGRPNGHYSVPYNCSQYMWCSNENIVAIADCAAGLVFVPDHRRAIFCVEAWYHKLQGFEVNNRFK